jgi:hypothetical protein
MSSYEHLQWQVYYGRRKQAEELAHLKAELKAQSSRG